MRPRRTAPDSAPPAPDRPAIPAARDYEQDIEQWEHLVWYVVNRLRTRLPASVAEEDLFAAGLYGLLRAARSYDPSRGAVFKTYAYHRIKGAILDDLRRADPLPRSLRDRARDEGVEAPAFVAIPTDEDGHESLPGEETLQEADDRDLHARTLDEIERLPDKMRVVMALYYGEDMKMREIGERLGLTESRVSQIHANAVARLQRSLRRAAG